MNNIANTKILLVVGGNSTNGVGGQFINAMLAGHSPTSIWRVSIVQDAAAEKDNIHPYPTMLQEAPFSAIPGKSSLGYWSFKRSGCQEGVDKINTIIQENDIELVWLVLNSHATIQIGARLSEKLNFPIIGHVWDTPEYLAQNMRLDPLTNKALTKTFADFMNRCTRAVTVSESMTKIFQQRYNVVSLPMVFCPPHSSWRTVKPKGQNKDKIQVVFAGSLYAYTEWNAFLNAIEERNQSSNFPKIEVTCIGNLSRRAKKRDWVNYEAIKPIDEAATLVSNADIAYLPYWMDQKHEYFTKTAFPGKMSFYVSSGTPVLFHGPKDSTPTDFLSKFIVGKCCHTLKEEDILNTIDSILKPSFLEGYESEQKRTLNKVFHPDRCVELFRSSLHQALNRKQTSVSNQEVPSQ